MRVTTILTIAIGLITAAAPAFGSRPPHAAVYSRAPVSEDLAIIVNKANPVDSLSFADLRAIFLGERGSWPNGKKITVLMRSPGPPEREAVLRWIYKMNESDYSRYSLQSTFTGQAQSGPKLLDSAAGMRRFVFNVPGAIGYVRAPEADESVKILRIDGHAPGEAAYRIKLAIR
ncbi:MAG: hypothetical protein DMF61_20120 [Blastocatellia bacterium AA13]|nr:MAG: hypothetical protein DMF61_20120 [Blastocatellia bacterium AA13]